MRASRTTRTATRRASSTRKHASTLRAAAKPAHKPAHKVAAKLVTVVEPVLFRFCKLGWAVLVEKQPNQQGTRFVCPFCSHSHRVSGPVRGFRKVRRAQWIKLRRVDE
jgi:hypothetical protein